MIQNIEKYNSIFQTIFGDKIASLTDLRFKVSPEWDSVSQIALISSIEEAFGIELEFEDIFSFNSYDNGKKILSENYGIVF